MIALCTTLEQRMVKAKMFCRQSIFLINYKRGDSWKTHIHFELPLQDAMELRQYILLRISEQEKTDNKPLLQSNNVQSISVSVFDFISEKDIQYNLFDNRIQRDSLRKAMYNIKDKYGKNSMRKASEIIEPLVMKDAIGFGSVKDLNAANGINNYLLEE